MPELQAVGPLGERLPLWGRRIMGAGSGTAGARGGTLNAPLS